MSIGRLTAATARWTAMRAESCARATAPPARDSHRRGRGARPPRNKLLLDHPRQPRSGSAMRSTVFRGWRR